jgi:murein DD-endopeptidase MepM/ murein hydrolase activator NlpD
MRGRSLKPGDLESFAITTVIAVLLFILPPINAEAKSPRIEIAPKIIRQGDAFIIRVTGTKKSDMPSAAVAKNAIHFSMCGEGCFIGIGGISLEARTGSYPVTIKAGGKRKNLRITVKKAAFPQITMTLPEEKVILSPDMLEVVKEENKRLKSLFLLISDRLWEGGFLSPVENTISTYFGTKRIMNKTWTSIHRGIDIKGLEGDEVRASNNGRVVLAQELFFGGNTIILDHGQGIHTVYMHLSQFHVDCGDSVSKGDVIGLIGSTGRSTGPHLHFGVKISNISVNPLSVLKLEL